MHEERLKHIHTRLQLRHGSFQEEFPEQLLTARYLTGNERVLEIGGNIGRNSLVIAHILNSNNGNSNYVSIESDPDAAAKLTENRNINVLDFYIETRALSKRKLCQKGWHTIISNSCPDGYFRVNTITVHELRAKYNIKFDTLILDCEGAFYYILKDMPEILDGIKMIIMENDYFDIKKKHEIDSILTDKGFSVEHREPGGWGPCYYFFYEIWCATGFRLREFAPLSNMTPIIEPAPPPVEFIPPIEPAPPPVEFIPPIEPAPPSVESIPKSFRINIQPNPGLNKPESQTPTVSFSRLSSSSYAKLEVNPIYTGRETITKQPSLQQFRSVRHLGT